MRREQRGHDGHRQPLLQRAGREQHAPLRLEVQPVPRLDLDRRHAFLQQRAQPRLAASNELVDVRGASRAHGVQDAAAFTRDVGVTRAGGAAGEFRGALPGEDDVRVAVDEPGCQPATRKLDRALGSNAGGQILRRTDPRDRVVFGDDGAVREDAATVVAGEEGEVAPDAAHLRG